MAFASTFELQLADGTPADPPTLTTAAPLWRPGDTIPLGARSLRVVEVRDAEVSTDRCWWSRSCPDERLAQPAVQKVVLPCVSGMRYSLESSPRLWWAGGCWRRELFALPVDQQSRT
jgi:hypothetical protein